MPKKLNRDERMDAREHRVISDARSAYKVDAELRAAGDDSAPMIEGYAAVFDTESELIGSGSWGFREIVRPEAFNKTVNEASVVALWNHDPNIPLGATKNNTLDLSIDARGLKYTITIDPESRQSMDVYRAIKRGDVDQSSFGFRTVRDRWTNTEDDIPNLRELLEVELFDVSPVTYPAYTATSVDARSICEAQNITTQNESEDADPAPVDDHADEPTIDGHSVRCARQRLAEISLRIGGKTS